MVGNFSSRIGDMEQRYEGNVEASRCHLRLAGGGEEDETATAALIRVYVVRLGQVARHLGTVLGYRRCLEVGFPNPSKSTQEDTDKMMEKRLAALSTLFQRGETGEDDTAVNDSATTKTIVEDGDLAKL